MPHPPEPMPDVDVRLAREIVSRLEWTFAKTVPESPHWYHLWNQTNDPEGFAYLEALILKHGDVRAWQIPGTNHWRRFRYLTLDGWDYWRAQRPYTLNRRHAVERPE